ncbi:MAG: helix-turn-helix domain-containing protein [Terriglobales bacterium]|jgi:hypothetical protein
METSRNNEEAFSVGAADGLERFVDSRTAAKFLSISPKWILLLARQGEIPAYPLGQGQQRSIWRFRLSELAKAMEERMIYRKHMDTVTESGLNGTRSRRS